MLAQNYNLQQPYFEFNGKKLQIPELGGLNSPQLCNIDLNLDGKQDILILEKNSGRIIPVLRFNDKFEVDYSIKDNLPELTDWILCRDFNKDGKVDIFTSTPGGISVYENISGANLNFRLAFEIVNSKFDYPSVTFTANIFVSSADIPFIDDLDGDGDLDILTFALGGNTIEHHKNFSVERTGNTGLDFELVNTCYAYVSDDFTGTAFDLGETNCPDNVNNPEKRVKHSGFTFGYIPGNPKNLLVGELTSNNLVKLTLGQSQFGGDSAIAQLKQFPANAPNNLIFINASFGFFDLDNTKDLLLTSNTRGSASEKSVYLYSEDGNTLKQNDFLQNETIDEGERASNTLLDWDNDGDKDLIISSTFRDDFLLPRLTFWENIGNVNNPKFKKIKSFDGDFSLAPPLTISNFKNNGQAKILLANSEGKIREYNFEDVFSKGFFANSSALQTDDGADLNAGQSAFALRVIGDNQNYLLTSNVSGTIRRYESTSNGYTLSSSKYLNLDFKGNRISQTLSLSVDSDKLSIFTQSGDANFYIINNGNAQLTSSISLLNLVGERPTATFVDIDGNDNPEIIVGTDDGGILIFSQSTISGIKNLDIAKNTKIYPTLANNILNIESDKPLSAYVVYNQLGKIMMENKLQNTNIIDVNTLSPGFYIVLLSGKEFTESHKFWKK